jgi:hypothetical protein
METRKLLGRYEIVSEAGRGAMGVVYKARDPKIDRFVAVKAISLLGQSPDEEAEYRERFFHEAQAAGRLLHPGIVTIFDVGEEPESRDPYIVMEFITGQSLNALLSGETKKLPLDTALGLAEELAEALDYAHAQGVVHRDIKPANILVTEEGHAKIADFGIAKLNLAHLTIPGHAMGTPAYMSPEQLEGQTVDGRSDLFSLGVVLYSMITGHKPFQGNNAASVCFKVTNRDPLPATSFDVRLPPALDAVIACALAKDPAQRYQRGTEFALAVRELRQHSLTHGDTTASVTAGGDGVRALFSSGSTVRRPTAGELARASRGGAGLGGSLSSAELLLRGVFAKRYLLSTTLLVAFGFIALLFGIPLYMTTTVGNHSKPPANGVVGAAPNLSIPARATNANPRAASGRTPARLAGLDIQVRHHFAKAKLSLWIDKKLAFSRSLRGKSKNHLLVLQDVQGFETAKVQVLAGAHSLRVHGQSDEGSFDESKTIVANFVEGREKTLLVDFGKRNGEMRLALQ